MSEPAPRVPALKIELFGPLAIEVNGQPLPRLRTRKGEWLLALLALRAGREVQRPWLAGTLWPDSSPSQSLALLRRALTDLRRALGPAARCVRASTPHTLSLDAAEAEVDLLAFDAAIGRGGSEELERAVALYHGPLLEGCAEEWALPERQIREQAFLAALETLAGQAQQRGDLETAECHLRRAVARDPLRESAQRALMQALAASGNLAAASEVYRALRLRLHRELNATPDAETDALYRQLRAEARARAATRIPAQQVERAWDIGEMPVRPDTPRPLGGHPPIPNTLPLPLTRFIGREDQVAELQQWLAEHRLVTLTGAGGCGKTRLALAVATERRASFPDGVAFVDLAPLADPQWVPQAVATALGLTETPGCSPTEALRDFLQPRHLLLVLDNCEHLLAACAHLAHALLQSGPYLRVLATSREALGITGERTYRVPPLSMPGIQVFRCSGVQAGQDKDQSAFVGPEHLNTRIPEHLLQYEAVRLFHDRATAVHPLFQITPDNAEAVIRICQRLEGMPLAIELAAVRVKALPVEQIHARLDDMFRLLTRGSRTALPRQQTLRAAIDWSHNLLSPSEQALLRRLSVFAGGWTLEAAEGVCADEGCRVKGVGCRADDQPTLRPTPFTLHPDDVLDLLTSLVEKSLVLCDEGSEEGRYRLLETVRQYARDRLLEAGEVEAVRSRHLGFFQRMAEDTEPKLHLAEQAAWMDRLEAEHDNLRVALAWSGAQGQGEAGLRLGGALSWFWEVRGHWTEGRARLVELLALPGAEARTAARAKALARAGWLALGQGDYGAARVLFEESLAISRELGDKGGIARSLDSLGRVAREQGDYGAARALFEESLATFRELGDKGDIARSLCSLAWVAPEQGAYGTPRALFEECLAIFRERGNKRGIAWLIDDLGYMAHTQGDYGAARALYEECLAMFRELRNEGGIARSLGSLGRVVGDQGDYGTARALLEKSLAIFRELGHKRHIAMSLSDLGSVAHGQGDYEAARALLEEGVAISRELGNKSLQAYVCTKQGHLFLEMRDYAAARSRYEEGLAMRRAGGDAAAIARALLEVGHAAWLQGEPAVTQSCAVEALGLFQKEEHQAGLIAAEKKGGLLAALESLAVAGLAQGVPSQAVRERAARLLGAGEAQWAGGAEGASTLPSGGTRGPVPGLGLPPPSWWRRPQERLGEAVRAARLDPELAAAWAEGRATPIEPIIAEALQEAPAI